MINGQGPRKGDVQRHATREFHRKQRWRKKYSPLARQSIRFEWRRKDSPSADQGGAPDVSTDVQDGLSVKEGVTAVVAPPATDSESLETSRLSGVPPPLLWDTSMDPFNNFPIKVDGNGYLLVEDCKPMCLLCLQLFERQYAILTINPENI